MILGEFANFEVRCTHTHAWYICTRRVCVCGREDEQIQGEVQVKLFALTFPRDVVIGIQSLALLFRVRLVMGYGDMICI